MTSDKTQWVWAPVPPTEEMIRAATKSMNNGSRSGTMKELISQDYKAMISAAPPAPAKQCPKCSAAMTWHSDIYHDKYLCSCGHAEYVVAPVEEPIGGLAEAIATTQNHLSGMAAYQIPQAVDIVMQAARRTLAKQNSAGAYGDSSHLAEKVLQSNVCRPEHQPDTPPAAMTIKDLSACHGTKSFPRNGMEPDKGSPARQEGPPDLDPITDLKYCAPRDCQERTWVLITEGQNPDFQYFTDEVSARKAFLQRQCAWACHLFEICERAALLRSGERDEK